MDETYADMRLHVSHWDEELGAYPVEASLDDGSRYRGGELHLDREKLLTDFLTTEEYGLDLFDALVSGRIRRAYDRATGQAEAKTGGRLRVRLWIEDEAAELHAIPWERIYHTHRGQEIPLATSSLTPFSRYTSLELAEARPVAEPTIQMLFAIASPEGLPSNLSPIHVEAEVEALAEALGDLPENRCRVTLLPGQTGISDELRERLEGRGYQVLKGATGLGNLLRRLPGHHILHFVGHGTFRREGQRGAGTAALYLEGERGELEIVRDDELVSRLTALDPQPHLIFLAACESAKRAEDSENPYVGLAPKLVRAGVPAVIAMQDLMPMAGARQLSADFYRRLLEYGVVDRALNEARNLLFSEKQIEWSVPVLFMRLEDGLLFLPPPPPRGYPPYKGLVSYGRDDAGLFKGRSELTKRICRRIRDHTVTVVYGEAGAGLTSLLQAGVRPSLEKDKDLVVSVSEYGDLADKVLNQLDSQRVVLVLDQFERVFELEPDVQAGIVSALNDSLEALGERLRVVFAIRSDYLARFAPLQDQLAVSAQPWIPVPVLDGEGATAAIVEPLRDLGWPVTLEPDFAQREIVRDLDNLYEPEETTRQGERSVDPGHLQIVCSWLYEAARDRDPPHINEELYVREAGGAEGILARYMADTLKTHLASEGPLARKILVRMAAPQADLRVTANGLQMKGVPSKRVKGVLEKLVSAELLVRRQRDGQLVYGFVSQFVAQEARRLGGQDLEDRYRAGDELERAWRMWLAAVTDPSADSSTVGRTLPDVRQLHYLAESGKHLRPRPQRAILLLRAAVARNQLTMHPWLDWIQTPRGEELVRTLEVSERHGAGVEETHAALEQARRLLGLGEMAAGADTESGGGESSAITRAAIGHHDSVIRRTAALVLLALQPSPDEALDRLQRALQQDRRRMWRWRRKAELCSTLFDADPSLPAHGSELSPADRLGVWAWRVWRRLVYDRQRILGVTLGAAAGAGLGLAVLRGVTAPATAQTPGIQLGTGIWWGFLLGAGLMLGLLLPRALILESGTTGEPTSPGLMRTARWLAVLLGALGFGVAHFLIAGATGYSGKDALVLVNLAALLMGLGLGAAFYGWRWREGEIGARRLLLRLLPVAVGALLGQIAIYLAGQEWSTAVGFWGTMYRTGLTRIDWRWWQELITHYPSWYQALGLLDAVLTGTVLFLGTAAGGRLAGRWLRKLQ